MAAGALLGLLVGEPIGVVKPVGDLFIRLLVMASIPLVFFNLLSGLTSLADARSVGRIGARIALYYVATTVLALGLGLAAMELLQPGRGFALRGETPERFGEMPGVVDVVLGLVPRNAFAAFAEGRVSQVVVFALLLGIAALALPEAQRARLRGIFDVFTAWMRRLVELILLAAPVGIGALAAVTVGAHGADLFGPVARFVGGVWAAQAVLLGVYLLLLVALARRRPVEFLRQGMPVFLTAAATASSLATLPVSLDTAEKRLGLPRSVIGFTLPLGAQVNKDGTALFLTAILMFTAQAAGAEFTLAQHFSILLVGLLLSEGSNGIPGGEGDVDRGGDGRRR